MSLFLRTFQSNNDRYNDQFNGMWGQMNVQNNNIAKAFDEMTDLRTVSNRLQHDVSGLQAGQQNLEGNVSGLQTDVSGLKTRVGNLEDTFEDTVKKCVKEEIAKSTRKKRPSKRVEVEDVDNDQFVNNDGDESDGESVGLFYNLKSCESPQQELYQQGFLSGAKPERATSIGARRASDDQSEENDEESNVNNDRWKLDDEGQGVDGADDDQMESDDSSDDEDSMRKGYCHQCRHAQAQRSYCDEKECLKYGLF